MRSLDAVKMQKERHLSSYRFFLEQLVEPPVVTEVGTSLEVDFRRQPPVRDEDLLLGLRPESRTALVGSKTVTRLISSTNLIKNSHMKCFGQSHRSI